MSDGSFCRSTTAVAVECRHILPYFTPSAAACAPKQASTIAAATSVRRRRHLLAAEHPRQQGLPRRPVAQARGRVDVPRPADALEPRAPGGREGAGRAGAT